ncbi:MAG TPA: bifunctional RNase H/acid phosphatase [Streptosporangiaceae bacterium]|jgi:probable phosphoglycerate mutase|nr:bifunctional RNase H/acid phosphatase [Streptosporangiaceae bacterium]
MNARRARLVVEADGGSRGNPGPAGYGALVRDAVTGRILTEMAEALGRTTNNVAEYRGLIAGLRAAARVSTAASVEVRMDSKLVVEQMSGRWKIKHPDMIPLAREARDVAAGFSSVRYTWVPRARNTRADRLANEAMDAAAQGKKWRPRPSDDDDDAEPGPGPGTELGTATRTADRTADRETERAAASGGQRGRQPSDPAAPAAGPARRLGWLAPTTAPTTTLLLRHGETPLSVERRFAGVGDIPLTDTGAAQARAAAAALAAAGVDAIVSSPLRRCRDTAKEIAAVVGASVREEDGFRETDFGAWEGLTFAEARERWPEQLSAWLADPAVAPPDGESFADTARRVGTALDKLMVRYRHQTVLVVSHVTPIKLLLRQALLAPPETLYRIHLDVGSLSIIDWYDDGPAVVRRVNDVHHLSP